MTICTTCGHANDVGVRFCRSCDSYLVWTAEPAAAVVGPTDTAEPATVVSFPSNAARLVDVPAPRLPEEEAPQRVSRRNAPLPGPSDLYCGGCGAGNAAGRRFCRRCGHPLDDAPAPIRLRWWQRAWQRLTSRPAPLPAGARPSSRRDRASSRLDSTSDVAETSATAPRRRLRPPRLPQRISLRRIAIPLAALSLLGFGLGPARQTVTHRVFGLYHSVHRDVHPTFQPIVPTAARGRAVAGHPAAAAIDANTSTWWSAPAGARPALRIAFDGAVDLARVGFDDGAAGRDFPFAARVRQVRIVLVDRHGRRVTRAFRLADTARFQPFDLVAAGVRSAQVTVLSTYAGQQIADVALREVEFLAAT